MKNISQSTGKRQLEDLPRFLDEASLPPPSQTNGRALPPPSPTETVSHKEVVATVSLHKRLTDYFWPVMFWGLLIYNFAVMGVAVYTMATEGFSAWVHAQAGLIVVFTTGLVAIIVKWILNGPNGIPVKRSTEV